MRPYQALTAALIAAAACSDGGGEPPPVIASLSLSPAVPDTLFSRGATVQLNVAALDANDDPIGNPQVTFSTANANVATVSNSGLVTAQNDGKVNITVSGGTASDAVEINVRRRVASVVVTPGSVTLQPAETQAFTASPRDANGNAIGGLAAEFTSSNSDVLTITTAGAATAGDLGSATVTATVTSVDGEHEGTASVTVSNQQFPTTATVTLGASSFNPSSVDIAVNGTVTWNNTSTVEHNVTFAAPSIPDIPNHMSGSNQRTFPTTGTFAYQCTIHAGMTGTVVVH
jgi:plastocyanin